MDDGSGRKDGNENRGDDDAGLPWAGSREMTLSPLPGDLAMLGIIQLNRRHRRLLKADLTRRFPAATLFAKKKKSDPIYVAPCLLLYFFWPSEYSSSPLPGR